MEKILAIALELHSHLQLKIINIFNVIFPRVSKIWNKDPDRNSDSEKPETIELTFNLAFLSRSGKPEFVTFSH